MRTLQLLLRWFASSGRVLVVAPTLFGYLLMALGTIPVPVHAGQKPPVAADRPPHLCCHGRCDSDNCCCCAAAEKVGNVQPTSVASQVGTVAGEDVTWHIHVAAPTCGDKAKLWLTENPPSVPVAGWLWQAAWHSLGWLAVVDYSPLALHVSPPSPPPRG
jgi:hypothetical protein